MSNAKLRTLGLTWGEYAVIRRARQVMSAAELVLSLDLAEAGDRGDLDARRLLLSRCFWIFLKANEQVLNERPTRVRQSI